MWKPEVLKWWKMIWSGTHKVVAGLIKRLMVDQKKMHPSEPSSRFLSLVPQPSSPGLSSHWWWGCWWPMPPPSECQSHPVERQAVTEMCTQHGLLPCNSEMSRCTTIVLGFWIISVLLFWLLITKWTAASRYNRLRECKALGNIYAALPLLTNLGQLVDDLWNQSSVDHCLDLLLVPSCNVGQEPDRFLQTSQSAVTSHIYSSKWGRGDG